MDNTPAKSDKPARVNSLSIPHTSNGKLAAATIEESEERFRTLFESMQEGFALHEIICDTAGKPVDYRFLDMNPAFERLTGLSREAVLGKTVKEVMPLTEQHWIDTYGRVALSGEPLETENYSAELDRYYRVKAFSPLRNRFVVIFEDVTAQKRALLELRKRKEELRFSEQKYSSIFHLMPDMVGITRMKDGCFIEVNIGFEKWTGWKKAEVIGRSSLDLGLWEPAVREQAVQIIKETGCLEEYEFILGVKSGEKRNALMYLTPIKVMGEDCLYFMARDITERKRAEEERRKLEQQLLHSQKLESLGVLAGGIAHDFNNILTSIIGNADLALMRLSPESPVLENLHRIEQAAARAADLARQMLAYSGKGKFVVEALDLNRMIEEMLHMLQVSISKKAVLHLNLHQPLPAVDADATQVRQVIMNLVINASEAIGDRSGVIAITSGCMTCDRDYLKDVWLSDNLPEGLYVFMEIADTGCGMDKETMGKIFDPFFTTKFTGRGLGMAAVLGIVRGHKGAIKVYSEAGKGTTFKVLLPASGRPVEISGGESERDDWRGSGTVLLVDDEENVRGIGSEMLKELGFEVITANDGRQALEKFQAAPAIDLVILDLTMPHMDGEQCFRELRRLNADVKVIISSGFSEYEVSQKFAGKGLTGFVQKPYKLSVLKGVVSGMAALNHELWVEGELK